MNQNFYTRTSLNKTTFSLPKISKIPQQQEPNKQEQNINLPNKNQKTFNFHNAIFTSEFNSGNMINCEKLCEDTYRIQISHDCEGIELNRKIPIYRVWFYFGVKSFHTKELNIIISNLNNNLRLFKSGYEIVYRELEVNQEPKDFENSYNLNEELNWKRFNNFTFKLNEEYKLELKLKHKFPKRKFILFAFCFPWSYDKNNAFLTYIDNKINNNLNDSNIYFYNEILIYSKEKRNVNLLTITSKDNIIFNQNEPNLIGLFPKKNRCKKCLHDKPIIVISARVHPGETPGTHMMNGIIKFLTDEKNEYSELLRKNFVFKIIPIINVDGVSNGNFRLDNSGLNLNRCYLDPEIKSDPEIYAIKKLFIFYSNQYKVRYYFDLHADMNVKGAYTFGNALEYFENHVENVLFGFIFHLQSKHINWKHCIYSENSMKTKFKGDNNSKEATSRVHFFKKTGLIHTYTLESSYFKGDFNENEENENDEIYQIIDFENTGKDCLISILLYEELITNDNIIKSPFNDVYGCREFIAGNIQINEERFNLDYGLRKVAKEINKRKYWMSLKEMNDKLILGRENRNKRISIYNLPKINRKMESFRTSINSINYDVKNNLYNSIQGNATSYNNNQRNFRYKHSIREQISCEKKNLNSFNQSVLKTNNEN